MTDCKNLKIEDTADFNGDIFDHPTYKYTCKLTGEDVIPCAHCKSERCENYDPA
jgi:hypothetical protein